MYSKRFLAAVAAIAIVVPVAAKKKNPDEITQSLELPKDPPAVAMGESRRLVFHVSALSGKGLLSQQTRDALKTLMKESANAPVIHVRAFVAGSGDIRRVPQIVSEVFSEKKMALPSVSVVLAGAVPLENAQVVLETISLAKKDVNPAGIQFVGGERSVNDDPSGAPRPLLAKALESLAGRLQKAQALRITCFVSNLTDASEMSSMIGARFPATPVDLVQPQRLPLHAFAQCEAVARGGDTGGSQIAFTGTRVAFGSQEKDAGLAWQRLDRDLKDAGVPANGLLYAHLYELHPAAAELARGIRGGAHPILSVPVEGLASIDAGFAVDAVAVIHK